MDFQLNISDNLKEVTTKLGELGERLKKTFNNSAQATKPLANSLSDLGSKLDALKKTRSLSVDSNQIKQLSKEIAKTEQQVRKMERSFEPLSKRLTGLGQTLSVSLTAPLVAFGVASLRTAGNFEAAMKRVEAKSQATSAEIAQLTSLAKRLGATTQFSATEAANGLEFLAQAGFNAKQQLQALPSVLNLAAAGNVDLGRASDIATDILSQFRLTAADTGRVVDVLAKATVSSNTNLDQLADAMNYLGPTAAAFGVTLEDAAAVVEVMANNGLKGSLGTRALGTALTRLTKPTAAMSEVMSKLSLEFFDSQGKFIGVEKTIALLENRMEGMTQKQQANTLATLFGAEAFQEFNILLATGSKKIGQLSGDLEKAGGTAAAIAAKNMEGLNGALKGLSSAFEAVQLALANSGLLEFFTALVTKATELLRSLSTLNPKLVQIIAIMGTLAAAIGPVLLVVGKLIPIFRGVALAISIAAIKIIAIVAVVGGLILVAKAIYDSWEPVSVFFKRFWAGLQIQFSVAIASLISSVEGLTKPFGITFDGAKEALKGFMSDALETLRTTPPVTFTAALGSVADNIKNTFVGLKNSVFDSIEGTNEVIKKGGESLVENTKTLGTGISGALQRPDAEGEAPQAVQALEIPLLPKLPEDLTPFMKQLQPLIDKTGELGEALQKPNEALAAFGQNIASSFSQAVQSVASGAATIKDAIRGIIKALISQGIAAAISNSLKSANVTGPFAVALAGAAGVGAGALFEKLIPKFATGGNHLGGLRIVGERGPELEATGASRIVPNNRLADMLGGGGSKQEIFGSISISGEQLQILLNNNANRNDFVI